MNRRNMAVLIAILGVITIGMVLYWMLLPVLQKQTVKQPPALPNTAPSGQPFVQPTTILPSQTPPVKVAPGSPTDAELAATEALKRLANAFAARSQTYASVDGFVSMQQVYGDASAEVRATLEEERQQLIKDHPATAPSWGQTTRVVSTKTTTGGSIVSATTAAVTVHVQQTTETATNGSAKTTYQEMMLSFKKVGSDWQVVRMEMKPFQP